MNDKTMQNLTIPIDIKYALEKKLGHGSMAKLGRKIGVTRQCVSLTVKGSRANESVLQQLADELGCGVYGVYPSIKQKTLSSGHNTAVNVGTAMTVPEDGHFSQLKAG